MVPPSSFFNFYYKGISMFKALGNGPVPQQQMPIMAGYLQKAQNTTATLLKTWSIFQANAFVIDFCAILRILEQKIYSIKGACEKVTSIRLSADAARHLPDGLKRHIEGFAQEVIELYGFVIQKAPTDDELQRDRALLDLSFLEGDLVDEEKPLFKSISLFHDLCKNNQTSLLPIFIASFFGQNDIPYDLLPENWHRDTQFQDKLTFLSTQGLLLAGGQAGTFSIHPFIQKMAEMALAPESKATLLTLLYTQLDKVWEFNTEDQNTWTSTELFIPHVIALLKATPEDSPYWEQKAKYFNEIGLYYAAVEMELREKIKCRSGAIQLLTEHLGEEHEEVVQSRNDLASASASIEDFKQAMEYHRQALALYVHKQGENHPNVTKTNNFLGTLFETLGSLEEAEAHYKKALESYIAYFNNNRNHPTIAHCYIQLGNVSRKQRQDDFAKSHYQSALEVLTACTSQDKLQGNIPLSQFAYLHEQLRDLCQKMGLSSEAREHRKDARFYNGMIVSEALRNEIN